MNTNKLFTLCLFTLLTIGGSYAGSFGTGFTYQGRLTSSGSPANGTYDFNFSLFDSVGISVSATQTLNSVSLSNGVFTVGLDFGSSQFNGDARLLQISVRTNGSGVFTSLSPRQAITPTPYSLSASNVLGPVSAAQLTGSISSPQLSGVYSGALTLNNPGNVIFGNGASISNINAQTLGGVGSGSYWKTLGNSGTVAGSNFFGTTDNQPVEIKVNGQRAFRLEPTTNAPNVIGGASDNMTTNAIGATIGGGSQNTISSGYSVINYSTVAGGLNNQVQASQSSISGGSSNSILSDSSTIGGGIQNMVNVGGSGSTIGGGLNNFVAGYGGSVATISGGQQNFVGESSGSSVGGGINNTIAYHSSFSSIAGGEYNHIEGATDATIAGGNGNSVFASGGTIAGGTSNLVDGYNLGPKAYQSTIGGGYNNTVAFLAQGGTIAGGMSNLIGGFGYQFYSAIGGGSGNVVGNQYGTVPGGRQASASHYGQMAYSGGQFAAPGDAQTSTYVARTTTTNNAQTELFLDGQLERMVVPTNSTWSFDIQITGRTTNGSSAVYQIRGGIRNNGGTTSQIGVTDVFTRKDVVAWDAVALADAVNNALVVKVTGVNGSTIRWVSVVHTAEVVF
jgi:hypothetical protein